MSTNVTLPGPIGTWTQWDLDPLGPLPFGTCLDPLANCLDSWRPGSIRSCTLWQLIGPIGPRPSTHWAQDPWTCLDKLAPTWTHWDLDPLGHCIVCDHIQLKLRKICY